VLKICTTNANVNRTADSYNEDSGKIPSYELLTGQEPVAFFVFRGSIENSSQNKAGKKE